MPVLSLWVQIKALVIKHAKMKYRKRSETFQEIIYPIYFTLILILLKLFAYKPESFGYSGEQNITKLDVISSASLRSAVYFVAPDNTDIRKVVDGMKDLVGGTYQMYGNKTEMDEAYLKTNGTSETTNYIGIYFPNDTVSSYALRYPYESSGQVSNSAFNNDARNCRSANSSCPPNTFIYSGFALLQSKIDVVLARLYGNSAYNDTSVSAQLFPLPAATYNIDTTTVISAFYFVWALSPFLTFLLVNIVWDKEKKIKEAMSMMGMSNLAYWLSWSITYNILIFVMTMVMTIMSKFGKLFEHSNFLIIFLIFFLYGISIEMFAFMITPFFARVRSAGGAGTFSTLLMSLLYLVIFLGQDVSDGVVWVVSLLSPTAFAIAIGQASTLEITSNGAQWDNMTEGPYPLYIPMVMLAVDILLYFALTFYLDAVIPGEYGTHKPFYFFLLPSYWMPSKRAARRQKKRTLSVRSGDHEQVEAEERVVDESDVAIRISRVSKTYTRNIFLNETVKSVHAVKNFSLDIYKGEITALLGHNGAGKTTIFNILAGFVPMTQGQATIFDYDVTNTEDLDEIRRMTGVCPQHNILFDFLSVIEHLELFAGLKCLSGEKKDKEINNVLHEIGLEDEKDTKSKHLSGGQKRKLCVGLAILGNPKVLILDEPTAGMDPYSRRNLWDLLRNRRENCVTLLTTHFMDEADVLADRKAILSKGKLRCVGSSLFLKNKFGVGYHLGISKDSETSETPITSFVSSHIDGCELKRNVGQELSYVLPMSQVVKFPDFFTELEENQDKLGIQSYGVSMTSLEEVFLKIGEDEEEHDEVDAAHFRSGQDKVELLTNGFDNAAMNGDDQTRVSHVEVNVNEPVFDADKCEESTSVRQESIWRSMFWRMFLINTRSPGILIFGLVIPSVMTVMSVYLMSSSSVSIDYTDPPMVNVLQPDYVVSPYLYKQPQGSDYGSYIYGKVKGEENDLVNVTFNKPKTYLASNIKSYTDNKATYIAMYNSTAIYSLAASINVFSNTLLNNLSYNGNDNPNITTYLKKWPARTPQTVFNSGQFGGVILAGISLVIVAAIAIVTPVKERELKIHPQLRISGVTFVNYWSASLVAEYITFLVPSIAYIIAIVGFDVASLNNAGAIISIVILLIGYGVVGILTSYCFGFLFNKHETAMGAWPTFAIFMAMLPYIVVSLLDLLASSDVALVINVICMILFPYYDILGGLYYISKVYLTFFIANKGVEKPIPASAYFDWSNPMVPFALIMVYVHIVVLWGALYVISVKKDGGKISNVFKNSVTSSDVNINSNDDCLDDEEDDVREEREKVATLLDGGVNSETDRPVIMMHGIRKEFVKRTGGNSCKRRPPKETTKVAVRNLAMSVYPGEVMGLLGPNGAGKTTALNVLTADTGATKGRIVVAGKDVTSNTSDVFQLMGYCPQTNPLWDTLTLEEHLDIYARIRGVKGKYIKPTIDSYISALGIEEHREKRAKTLSGGTMRKLCFAIAMLGNPQIVLLDEPSTGMDPKTKRFMWNTISQAFGGSKRGAILTTHYMEEADALCSRIGIMVRGQLKCIGSTQHLKNKYGDGYILEIKLKITEEQNDFESLHAFVQQMFPSVTDPEKFEQRVVYKVKREDVTSLAKVFRELEESKSHIGIEEYSFSQSTLEQVFLEFAKEQEQKDEEEKKRIAEEKRLERLEKLRRRGKSSASL